MENKSQKTVKKAAKKAIKKVAKKAVKKVVKKAALAKPSTRGLLRKEAIKAESTALDTLYIVDDSNNQVTLEVNIGAEGQTSNMTIKVDDNIITENIAGDFTKTSLGTNKELAGKVLRIIATIADTSRDTNFTSLTIHLKGGIEDSDFPLSKTVDEQGDSADYICRIEFFKP